MNRRGGIIVETWCNRCKKTPMWAVDPIEIEPVCDQCVMEEEEMNKHFEEQR